MSFLRNSFYFISKASFSSSKKYKSSDNKISAAFTSMRSPSKTSDSPESLRKLMHSEFTNLVNFKDTPKFTFSYKHLVISFKSISSSEALLKGDDLLDQYFKYIFDSLNIINSFENSRFANSLDLVDEVEQLVWYNLSENKKLYVLNDSYYFNRSPIIANSLLSSVGRYYTVYLSQPFNYGQVNKIKRLLKEKSTHDVLNIYLTNLITKYMIKMERNVNRNELIDVSYGLRKFIGDDLLERVMIITKNGDLTMFPAGSLVKLVYLATLARDEALVDKVFGYFISVKALDLGIIDVVYLYNLLLDSKLYEKKHFDFLDKQILSRKPIFDFLSFKEVFKFIHLSRSCVVSREVLIFLLKAIENTVSKIESDDFNYVKQFIKNQCILTGFDVNLEKPENIKSFVYQLNSSLIELKRRL